MRILAWVVLVLNGVLIVCEPFIFGKSRGVYGPTSYMATLLGFCMMLCLCGRVLGWW